LILFENSKISSFCEIDAIFLLQKSIFHIYEILHFVTINELCLNIVLKFVIMIFVRFIAEKSIQNMIILGSFDHYAFERKTSSMSDYEDYKRIFDLIQDILFSLL